jgi:hypothetical protein
LQGDLPKPRPGFVEHPEVAVHEAYEMVGARCAHRVGGNHVPFGVRGVAKAGEAAVEYWRQGDGRRSNERGRKGWPCQRQSRWSCRTGLPWNSMKGDGPVSGDRPCPQGGERPDLVDRLPDERDVLRDLRSGRRRRPGSYGISAYRDGEEDHDGGNNPPEEGAYHGAFKEISSEVHFVLSRFRMRPICRTPGITSLCYRPLKEST